jgi:hypothetical protein
MYGESIANLHIEGKPAPYGVLNERDARAGAGIMLVIGMFTFVQALILNNFFWLTLTVFAFFVEFLIRIFNPKYAPFYAIGHFIVRNQRPEWSGAIQKRFAWSLGLGMASLMIILALLLGVKGWAPLSICTLCLFLLWAESVFGICIGCKLYYGLQTIGWVAKPDVAPACPGGVCPMPKK